MLSYTCCCKLEAGTTDASTSHQQRQRGLSVQNQPGFGARMLTNFAAVSEKKEHFIRTKCFTARADLLHQSFAKGRSERNQPKRERCLKHEPHVQDYQELKNSIMRPHKSLVGGHHYTSHALLSFPLCTLQPHGTHVADASKTRSDALVSAL